MQHLLLYLRQLNSCIVLLILGKLTNPAFAAHLLDEVQKAEQPLTHESANQRISSLRVANAIRQAVSSESLQAMRLKSEKILSSTLYLVKGDRDGTEVSLASLLLQVMSPLLTIFSKCLLVFLIPLLHDA